MINMFQVCAWDVLLNELRQTFLHHVMVLLNVCHCRTTSITSEVKQKSRDNQEELSSLQKVANFSWQRKFSWETATTTKKNFFALSIFTLVFHLAHPKTKYDSRI